MTKKEHEIGNTYNCGLNKTMHSFLMISATCIMFGGKYIFGRLKKINWCSIMKLWNKLFKLVYINPGPPCGSTFLVCILICILNARTSITSNSKLKKRRT